MKKIKTLLTIAATVAMLALPVAAKNAIVTADAAQDACSDDGKRGLYATFRENLQKDQAKAYDAAKKYLACPAAATPTEGEQKIVDYLKNFVTKYEAVTRKNRLNEILYNEKNYAEAFKVGREVLAGEPENIEALVHLGANGYLVAPLNNPQLVTEAIQYATKSLQMLDGGKTLTDWGPLKSKDVAVAYLNYTIGSLTIEKDPSGALKHLIKSAQFATPLKDSAITYALIAGAYETGPYAKQSDEYKKMYLDKDETPESKLALANINQIVDRMIDAYARAVALAGSNADLAKQKTTWNESLLQWYKFRNKSEAGMNELVASILSKPLPPEPTPLTSLPAAPASTPVGTSGGATPTNATGTGTGNGAAATPNKPATTTAPATAPASANTKPTPKPGKPRR
ncbi:MAG TPA: hypothetical protein VFB65_14360 [Pyrinomonadaceae bacterium]|nr:hypothetical protein [Pyrinomonadaceae bacterium]